MAAKEGDQVAAALVYKYSETKAGNIAETFKAAINPPALSPGAVSLQDVCSHFQTSVPNKRRVSLTSTLPSKKSKPSKNSEGEAKGEKAPGAKVKVIPAAAAKKPAPVPTAAKKKKEPSSDDSSSEDEAPKKIPRNPVAVPAATKKKPKSSSEDSSFEDEAAPKSKNESSELFPMEEEGAHRCLFIENILDVVFKHIIDQPMAPKGEVAKDVQSIRLVCKTWNTAVTRTYRRRNGPVAEFTDYDHETGGWRPPLSDFMDMLKSCELIPVQKFRFCLQAFQSKNLDLFVDFFRMCGPEVVSLELDITHDEANKLMRSLRDLPELNFPELTTLKIHPSYYECGVRKQPGIVTLVERLLTAAKTLHELELSYPPSHRHTHPNSQVAVMTQLVQAIGRRSPRTLKQLKLGMEVAESTFDNLVEAGLTLEGFEYEDASKLGIRTLYKFLESQAPTLNALRIYASYRWRPVRDPIRMDISVELPFLGQLVELELSDVIVSRGNSTRFDLDKTFPKLERLELPRMKNETAFRALLSSAEKPAQSLKVLHLPMFWQASLAPFVAIAARSFPSITELHIQLRHQITKETMVEVFKHFGRLKALHISIQGRKRNPDWLESILSGTSETVCGVIRMNNKFGEVNLARHQKQPSILDLTGLRKLVVKWCDSDGRRHDWDEGWIPFSDFSAHFILLGMETLRYVELAKCDVRFTREYLDLLKDKLVLRE